MTQQSKYILLFLLGVAIQVFRVNAGIHELFHVWCFRMTGVEAHVATWVETTYPLPGTMWGLIGAYICEGVLYTCLASMLIALRRVLAAVPLACAHVLAVVPLISSDWQAADQLNYQAMQTIRVLWPVGMIMVIVGLWCMQAKRRTG